MLINYSNSNMMAKQQNNNSNNNSDKPTEDADLLHVGGLSLVLGDLGLSGGLVNVGIKRIPLLELRPDEPAKSAGSGKCNKR
jgi:hypothetical protein